MTGEGISLDGSFDKVFSEYCRAKVFEESDSFSGETVRVFEHEGNFVVQIKMAVTVNEKFYKELKELKEQHKLVKKL